jgi:hypothetical protein
VDTRTIKGDADANAIKLALERFWKNSDIKVSLVDYDVLNAVLTDYDDNGYKVRLINQIADEIREKGGY